MDSQRSKTFTAIKRVVSDGSHTRWNVQMGDFGVVEIEMMGVGEGVAGGTVEDDSAPARQVADVDPCQTITAAKCLIPYG